MALAVMEKVHFRFQSKYVLRNASIQVRRGDRIVLIGPNGSGKSSVLHFILKKNKPDEGSIVVEQGIRIGHLPQSPYLEDEEATLFDTVVAGRTELLDLRQEVAQAQKAVEDGDIQKTRLFEELHKRYELEGGDDIERRATIALQQVGYDQEQFDQLTKMLSMSERSRLLLARALVMDADLLLLDEPTIHLDIRGIEFLEQYLAGFLGGAVVVSNDRAFIDRFATVIAAIEPDGSIATYPGNYDNFIKIRRERLKGSEEKIAEHIDSADNLDEDEYPIRYTKVGHSGKIMFQVKDLTLQPGSQILLEKTSFNIARGERVGIIGPKGCGKTNLLKTLVGQEQIAGGRIQQGFRTMVGYYDGDLNSLTTGRTVLEELASCRADLNEDELRKMAETFLFKGDDVNRKVENLSNSEQSRLALLILIIGDYNVLALDEPTHQLDIQSREVLEEALIRYPSTIVVVSHDRSFLDRVARRILSFEGRSLMDRTGMYAELRKKGRIMKDISQIAQKVDKRKQRSRETEDSKPKKANRQTTENAPKSIQDLEDLIKEQEKQIDHLMDQMADPARALDWEGLEKLQQQKKVVQKENEAAIKQLERKQANLSK